ncbi:MAG: glycosyltransferase family 2 protein, partial [Okeania sp. SIO2D1]|nr:glycosyltransferase family 2 protein [Okeania sp. SIO2D1]
FFGASEVDRRRALKDFSLRLPFRPVIRFIYMYIFLKGFLDGQGGLAWCTLQAFYEYLILIKVWEMKNMPVPSLTSVIDANSSKVEIEAQG